VIGIGIDAALGGLLAQVPDACFAESSASSAFALRFGLFAVTAMLVCYALERKSPWFILGFAAACALGSVYGFLQGAWPFGVIEAIWSLVALWRWKHSK
jgi:hypothetical protein